MKLKKIIPIVVIFLFTLLGCTTSTSNDVEVPSFKAFVNIDGKDYEMNRGGYQWSVKRGLSTQVVSTDHASPNQMAENIDPISVKPNQEVNIQIEDNPKIKVHLWNETGLENEIEHNNNVIVLPSQQGKYIYEVAAEWKNGNISYVFVVDVR